MTVSAPVRLRASSLWMAIRLQWNAAPLASTVELAFSVSTGSMAAVAAWLSKQLFDSLAQAQPDRQRVTMLVWAVATVGGISMAVLHMGRYLGAHIRSRLDVLVNRLLFEKVISFEGLTPFESPEFLGRLKMAEQAAQDAPHQVGDLLFAVVRTVVGVGTLLVLVMSLSKRLALLLAVAGLIGIVAQLWRTRDDAAQLGTFSQLHRWRDFYRALLVDPRAAKESRLFGLGEMMLGRLTTSLKRAGRLQTKLEARGSTAQVALTAVSTLVIAAGLSLVATATLSHRLTLGDATLFIAAVAGIQNSFTGLLSQLGSAGRSILMFETFVDIVNLPVPLPRYSAHDVPVLRNGIELRDVWFRYHPEGPWVLRGVNLHIAKGRATGLVGVNGAGKSTLVKLLCGFYRPERGEILWDGVDIRAFNPAALRSRMAATFQDFMTYDFSAAVNVGLGDLERLHDETRIRAAAALAHVDGTLSALPQGYDTQLSRVMEREDGSSAAGVSLSGGEWQRVALARSLMRRDVDLLLLDEPSSGLDAEAEHRIHQTLQNHGSGSAKLLISHRLNALREAHEIAVLVDGRVAETGSHEELMARGGTYERLFTLQSEGYQRSARPAAQA